MLDAALALVRRGFAVLPLQPRKKQPCRGQSVHTALRTEGEVRAFWAAMPDANVAVAAGAISGVVILDVDTQREGPATLARLIARIGLPPTFSVQTGQGGQHIYFAYPGGEFSNAADWVGTNGEKRAGLEFITDGHYVVGPGSVHPNGNRYLVTADLPLAPVPEWLLHDIQATRAESAPRAPEFVADDIDMQRIRAAVLERGERALQTAAKGARNRTLNKVAFTLGGVGVGLADALTFCQAATAAWVGDACTAQEIRATIKSGWQNGQRRPVQPYRPTTKNLWDQVMVVVKIELWPAGLEAGARELGRIVIINDGTGDREQGNYNVELHKSPEYAKSAGIWRKGRVTKFWRKGLGVYDLLYRALRACVGDRNR